SPEEPSAPNLRPDRSPLPTPPIAKVDLYSTLPDGSRIQEAVVRIGTVTHRRNLLLPPLVLFDQGATVPPGYYVRLSPENRPRFSPDSIARLDPATACNNLLNIVGSNMQANPHARVRLTGSRASDEPAGTGR